MRRQLEKRAFLELMLLVLDLVHDLEDLLQVLEVHLSNGFGLAILEI